MTPTRNGSFRLFRFSGIDVYLHWSWFLVAAWQVSARDSVYTSPLWNVFEYLALFGIVLMHEFGHSLACRQVGGRADQIVLWPLGGVAYVAPPQRPGANLWSIAAGPLVNVVLFPILTALRWAAGSFGWETTMPNLYQWIGIVWFINTGLLIFNLLPVFPLDGGQMLRALLWYRLGRGKSLLISTIIGFIGAGALLLLSLYMGSIWTAILAGFLLTMCWQAFQHARALVQTERAVRRDGFACPSCRNAPPVGELWLCGRCQQPFDTFATLALCPRCATRFDITQCMDCGSSSSVSDWMISTSPVPPRIRI